MDVEERQWRQDQKWISYKAHEICHLKSSSVSQKFKSKCQCHSSQLAEQCTDLNCLFRDKWKAFVQ